MRRRIKTNHTNETIITPPSRSVPAPPSISELSALRRWASAHGRTWKSELIRAWGSHVYGSRPFDDGAQLHGLRNRLGPRWLARFRFDR
jgi:hypothetical protein